MLDRTIAGLIEGQDLLRLSGDTKVREAARQMSARHVGAILVHDADKDCGVFTERDMLDRVVAGGLPPDETVLREVMTPDPAFVGPEDTVRAAIFAMKRQRSRHLLVKDRGEIFAIVSVRDLLRSVVEESAENQQVLDDLWEGFPV